MNSVIVHCLPSHALHAWQQGQYCPDSLAKEGFIHCCTLAQLDWVLAQFYRDDPHVHLLLLEASLLGNHLKFEPAIGVAVEGVFPHLYGPIPPMAVLDCVPLRMFQRSTVRTISRRQRQLCLRYHFERLPVEGTLYTSTWRSHAELADGGPVGTAMLGLYTDFPLSVSCFHRLTFDEVWHFYEGTPLDLFLLYPDGRTEQVRLGPDDLRQFVVPAGVWQAGRLAPAPDDVALTSWPTSTHVGESRYALFGCTMAPGFTGRCFEAAQPDLLQQLYPSMREVIAELSVNEHQTRMPEGFAP